MNTMVKGLRYTKRDRAAWNNDFQQLAKVASHLGEPLTYRSLYFGM